MSDTVKAGAGQARQEAAATGGEAREAAGRVAGTAAEQARAVTGEAREQGMTAVRELQDRARDEAETQTHRTAETVRHWAEDLSGMAESAEGDSPARRLVAQVADGGQRAADYLDDRGVDGLLQDVQGFARRRPAAFLGAAAIAGLAVGRLAKAGSASRGNGHGGDGHGDGYGGTGRGGAEPGAVPAESARPQAAWAEEPEATGWPARYESEQQRGVPRREV
ncbi:hypothetical protein WDH52_08080 [Streptomyces sp. TRM70308]|uniref:hypothetical protein n=1 Tax=Streptomyces sp. TRM70308 TaxID=3131932 RepID=UPI003CFE30FF